MTTANDIIARLKARYSMEKWMSFVELRASAGCQGYGPSIRTIDFAAIHRWQSRDHRFVCVEVKVSRSDWRRELEQPEKRKPWQAMADEFWFAAPSKVIPVAELPNGCGLMETWGDKLRIKRAAVPNDDATGPTPDAWVMLLRNADEQRKADRLKLNEFADFADRRISLTDLLSLAEKYGSLRRWEIESRIRAELSAEQRERNVKHGDWAAVEQTWKWTLRQLYDDVTPERAEEAMKLLFRIGAIRKAARALLDDADPR